MKYIISSIALAATVSAQGAAFDISPDSESSCPTTFNQNGVQQFSFSTVETSSTQPAPPLSVCGNVVVTLQDGNLVDQYRRTGSIVDNRQFQFDGPPQTGTVYSSGWSACEPSGGEAGRLNLGDQEIFYNCYNAATETAQAFYNIYDEEIGNCTEVYLYYTPCNVDAGPCAQTEQAGRNGNPPYNLEDPTANIDSCAEFSDDSPRSASSSSSSSASASASSSATSSASSYELTSTPMTGQQDYMTMMTESLTPVTEMAAAPTVVPAPASNATSAATGTGGGASPTGPTAVPSPFTGAGEMVVVCKGFVGVVAGVAALAMF